MSESILISDPREIEAAANGEMPSETYADGEVYVLATDLIRWRNRQPLAVLEASIGESL